MTSSLIWRHIFAFLEFDQACIWLFKITKRTIEVPNNSDLGDRTEYSWAAWEADFLLAKSILVLVHWTCFLCKLFWNRGILTAAASFAYPFVLDFLAIRYSPYFLFIINSVVLFNETFLGLVAWFSATFHVFSPAFFTGSSDCSLDVLFLLFKSGPGISFRTTYTYYNSH